MPITRMKSLPGQPRRVTYKMYLLLVKMTVFFRLHFKSCSPSSVAQVGPQQTLNFSHSFLPSHLHNSTIARSHINLKGRGYLPNLYGFQLGRLERACMRARYISVLGPAERAALRNRRKPGAPSHLTPSFQRNRHILQRL